MSRYPFPAVPDGWYVVALSKELGPGELRTLRYFDTELVLFRGEDGQAHALDAWCPHLGAHMGHGGKVVGNTLRCPFHGFRFDGGGKCVEAPFADRIPPAARTKPWPVLEQDEQIFVYFHARREAPTWTPPARLGPGWCPIESVSVRARHHVQDLAESTVDSLHTVFIHGYPRPGRITDVRADGPFWSVKWHLTLPGSYAGGHVPLDPEAEVVFAGGPLGSVEEAVYTTLDVRLSGMGIVDTLNTLQGRGWPHLVRFALTPIDREWLEMRVIVSVQAPEGTDPGLIHALNEHTLAVSTRDTRQDSAIFALRRYPKRPAIVAVEAPLIEVRRWAKQFYSTVEEG